MKIRLCIVTATGALLQSIKVPALRSYDFFENKRSFFSVFENLQIF